MDSDLVVIKMFESILCSNDNEKLENKYLVTVIRNIIKDSDTINIKYLIKNLKQIGYKNHSYIYINKFLDKFKISSYIKSYNNDSITLHSKNNYEKKANYLTYKIETNNKFTFNIFKKEAICFLYSKPSIVHKKKMSDTIAYTTQGKISKHLNLSQSAISKHTKGMNKVYAFKKVKSGFKKWEDAKIFLINANNEFRNRYSIISDYEGGTKRCYKYDVIVMSGSILVRDEKIKYKSYINNKPIFKSKVKKTTKSKYTYSVLDKDKKDDRIINVFGIKTKIKLKYNKLHECVYDSNNSYMYMYSNELNLNESNACVYNYYTSKNMSIGEKVKYNTIIKNNIVNYKLKIKKKELVKKIKGRGVISGDKHTFSND